MHGKALEKALVHHTDESPVSYRPHILTMEGDHGMGG